MNRAQALQGVGVWLVAYLLPKQDFLLVLMHGKGITSGNRKWNSFENPAAGALPWASPKQSTAALRPGLQGTGAGSARPRLAVVSESLSHVCPGLDDGTSGSREGTLPPLISS